MGQDYGRHSGLAQQLHAEQVQRNMELGRPREEAETSAAETLEFAYGLCEMHGELDREPDADWLFQAAAAEPEVASHLAAARADGATDQDIREWHSRPFLARALLQAGWEEDSLFDAFAHCEGLVGDDELHGIYHRAPVWQVATEEVEPDMPVQPLPVELYPRYERWAQRRDADWIEQQTKAHGSCNALIRAEIAAGKF